jgi:hypothetical protein
MALPISELWQEFGREPNALGNCSKSLRDSKSVPQGWVLALRLLLTQSSPQLSDMLLDKLDKSYEL